MKLKDVFLREKPTLSFEVFPPKRDAEYQSVQTAVDAIAALVPDFMSVTYGAGGGTSALTVQLAENIGRRGVTSLAHLTCVSSNREEVRGQLALLRDRGIENVLALRGDLPEGRSLDDATDYRYAAQLVEEIRDFGGFSIGAACYPEGHVDAPSQGEDLVRLREKVERGCDFLITQMFFDNAALYSFLYRAERSGIHVPVVAGVMPVTNAKQIARICALSGTTLPNRFRMIVDKFGSDPEAMRQAGIAYATEQIVDLIANGVRGVHVYTMNKPEIAAQISANLSCILGRP
jgi:methylenetetrahydrofolate reductase (NADPH)